MNIQDPLFILFTVIITVSIALRLMGEVIIQYFDHLLDGRHPLEEHEKQEEDKS